MPRRAISPPSAWACWAYSGETPKLDPEKTAILRSGVVEVCMASPYDLTLSPAGEMVLHQCRDGVQSDAHYGQDEQPGEDQRYIEVAAGDHHHVTDALVGGDGLRQYGADERRG